MTDTDRRATANVTKADVNRLSGELHAQLATPESFEAWLKDHADGDIIGMASSSQSCPIAAFAIKVVGIPENMISIGLWQATVIHDGADPFDASFDMPDWTQRFIRRIDGRDESGSVLYDDEGNARKAKITVFEALTALREMGYAK